MKKKLLALFSALAMLLLFTPTMVLADSTSDGYLLVYAQVPEDWSNPCIWAWSDDGASAFDAWPGGEMEADAGNEGWYYCWIPEETTNVIINANNGEVQTGDYKLEVQNAWITVTDAETVEISYDALTEGDLPEYVETFKVHAQVPEDWTEVGLWAWSAPDGTNAFDAWPGKTMKDSGDGWYTASAPIWVNSIIINGNEGSVQTEDISIDPAEIWVTVSEDGSYDFTYNDPNAPEAEDITVHVIAPDDWNEPHLWAWSAPDGTNAFTSWPGEALEDDGSGWLTIVVPGWINSVIVNGNEGSIQTSDLSVETGVDIWIVVTDEETVDVSYEEPDVTMETESTDIVSTEDTVENDEAESETEVETVEEETNNNSSTIAIVVIILVVIVIAVIIVIKRKKD